MRGRSSRTMSWSSTSCPTWCCWASRPRARSSSAKTTMRKRMTASGVTWSLQTPPGTGALAVIWLTGEARALEAAAGSLGVAIEVGSLRLRDLLGIDRGIVARWADGGIALMPHGGPAVVRAIAVALESRGIRRAESPDSLVNYLEAEDETEARMLGSLAMAAS